MQTKPHQLNVWRQTAIDGYAYLSHVYKPEIHIQYLRYFAFKQLGL